MGTESEGVCSALRLTRGDLMGFRHKYQQEEPICGGTQL